MKLIRRLTLLKSVWKSIQKGIDDSDCICETAEPVTEQSEGGLLHLCEGNCSNDQDCNAGLKCFQRDNEDPDGIDDVPGCFGKIVKDWNYCIREDVSCFISFHCNNHSRLESKFNLITKIRSSPPLIWPQLLPFATSFAIFPEKAILPSILPNHCQRNPWK